MILSKKWLVMVGVILVQISIGAIYTWSLFNEPLMEKFGWEKQDVVLTFSITIAVFAFSTIFAGKLQDRIGARWVATAGGVLLGLGLILASTADTIWELYLFYGVIGGIGVGTAYVCPLATSVKWFPNSKGLITGITVGAFGLGSLLFKPIIINLIESVGVSATFFYLGIIYMVLIVIGAQLLVLPPENYYREQTNNVSSNYAVNHPNEYTLKEMLNTRQFYLLWVMFFLGTISGLMIIGLVVDIGIELANLTHKAAYNAVVVVALFNALGRILWGSLSDKIGRVTALFYMYLLTIVSMLIMSFINMNEIIFFITLSVIAFSFGGFLSVLPAITAEFYGTNNLGLNYGVMFQAYGLAAIAGPVLASSLGLDKSFLLGAIMSMIALALTFYVKVPRKA